MNAIKFIQQHGVDKAREVVKGAPEFPVFGYCTVTGSYIFKRANATAYYHNETNSWSEEYAIELILLEDLKLLVESVDLIRKVGGVSNAKLILSDMDYDSVDWDQEQFSYYMLLEQAIADYEAIYGGEHV